MYIPSDCYLHVFHAAVRGGLELVDQLIGETFSADTLKGFTGYYASLAKLVNLWREKAADMMKAWDDQRGESADPEIQEMGKRYPLSVSSGRWGSVETAEEFFLQRGRSLVEPCMLQVLSRSMKADRDRDSDPATGRPIPGGNVGFQCRMVQEQCHRRLFFSW